jgi:hypothetical protein
VTLDENTEAMPKAADINKAIIIVGKKRNIGLCAGRADRHANIEAKSLTTPSNAVSELRRIACRWW